jgi:ATP-dependent DNA ligase
MRNYAKQNEVRNGFVPQVRRDVAAKLKRLETASCPFANLPEKKRTQWALTKEEMKNCVWLKAEVVAQVEFTEWTQDGHLRHLKFVGLREEGGGRRSASLIAKHRYNRWRNRSLLRQAIKTHS